MWTANGRPNSVICSTEPSGQGYPAEAVAALVNFGFTHLKLHRMVARTAVRHAGSLKVLARIGLRRAGHCVENFFNKGEWTS